MKSTKEKLFIGSVLMLLLLTLLAGQGYAAPPQTLTYRGSLSTSAGAPVNGSQVMVFSLYAAATGGTVLWTESHTGSQAVTVGNGNYSVVLGSITPLNLPFDTQYYLGITVGADAEMTPRMPLTSVGYAFNAGNGIPKGGIIMWSGAVNAIPTGWALCDGTNGTPDLRNRFVVGAGSTYAVSVTGGEATHTLTIAEMPSHTHVQNPHTHIQDPHSHAVAYDLQSKTNGSTDVKVLVGATNGYNNTEPTTATSQNTTAVNQNTGGTQPHNILPPYYALAFIMKL